MAKRESERERSNEKTECVTVCAPVDLELVFVEGVVLRSGWKLIIKIKYQKNKIKN